MDLLGRLQSEGWYLTEKGIGICSQNGNSYDSVVAQALNSELSLIAEKRLPDFPENVRDSFSGPLVLEIKVVIDVAVPKDGHGSRSAPPMLAVTFTDGHLERKAVVLSDIDSLTVNTPPGTKLKLNGKVDWMFGFFQLTSTCGQILGGKVDSLLELWRINKKLENYTRKVNTQDGGGPPPFVQFGAACHSLQNNTGKAKGSFKSLNVTAKKSDESSEFEEQRKASIAQAMSQQDTREKKDHKKNPKDTNSKETLQQQASSSYDASKKSATSSNYDTAKKSAASNDFKKEKPVEHFKRSKQERFHHGSRRDQKDDDDYVPGNSRPSGAVKLCDFLSNEVSAAIESNASDGNPSTDEKHDHHASAVSYNAHGRKGYAPPRMLKDDGYHQSYADQKKKYYKPRGGGHYSGRNMFDNRVDHVQKTSKNFYTESYKQQKHSDEPRSDSFPKGQRSLKNHQQGGDHRDSWDKKLNHRAERQLQDDKKDGGPPDEGRSWHHEDRGSGRYNDYKGGRNYNRDGGHYKAYRGRGGHYDNKRGGFNDSRRSAHYEERKWGQWWEEDQEDEKRSGNGEQRNNYRGSRGYDSHNKSSYRQNNYHDSQGEQRTNFNSRSNKNYGSDDRRRNQYQHQQINERNPSYKEDRQHSNNTGQRYDEGNAPRQSTGQAGKSYVKNAMLNYDDVAATNGEGNASAPSNYKAPSNGSRSDSNLKGQYDKTDDGKYQNNQQNLSPPPPQSNNNQQESNKAPNNKSDPQVNTQQPGRGQNTTGDAPQCLSNDQTVPRLVFTNSNRQRSRNKSDWMEGDICMARFYGDGMMYKAKVLHIPADVDKCLVKFIDYGNDEEVFIDDLEPISNTEYDLYPGQTQQLPQTYQHPPPPLPHSYQPGQPVPQSYYPAATINDPAIIMAQQPPPPVTLPPPGYQQQPPPGFPQQPPPVANMNTVPPQLGRPTQQFYMPPSQR